MVSKNAVNAGLAPASSSAAALAAGLALHPKALCPARDASTAPAVTATSTGHKVLASKQLAAKLKLKNRRIDRVWFDPPPADFLRGILSVRVPGQEDVSITLMEVPGPPVFEEDTRAKIKELLARGAAGGLFFAADDVQATFEELKGRGVEFTQEPTQQPYGLDAGFRDSSGNHFRMMEAG